MLALATLCSPAFRGTNSSSEGSLSGRAVFTKLGVILHKMTFYQKHSASATRAVNSSLITSCRLGPVQQPTGEKITADYALSRASRNSGSGCPSPGMHGSSSTLINQPRSLDPGGVAGDMAHAPLAASAGMLPFAIQMSISGCMGSRSLGVSRPNSRATVMKCTKQEFRSVQPALGGLPLVMCQKGSIK